MAGPWRRPSRAPSGKSTVRAWRLVRPFDNHCDRRRGNSSPGSSTVRMPTSSTTSNGRTVLLLTSHQNPASASSEPANAEQSRGRRGSRRRFSPPLRAAEGGTLRPTATSKCSLPRPIVRLDLPSATTGNVQQAQPGRCPGQVFPTPPGTTHAPGKAGEARCAGSVPCKAMSNTYNAQEVESRWQARVDGGARLRGRQRRPAAVLLRAVHVPLTRAAPPTRAMYATTPSAT